MGVSFNSDTSAADPQNSSTTPLAAFAEFVGTFVPVSGFSSVSVSCDSDTGSQFAGLVIEWSTNGVTANVAPQQFTFDPLAVNRVGVTIHATVRAQFYRVRYRNGFTAQTRFVLAALLRRGTPMGTVRSIDPTNTFIADLDVQTVQAILAGRGRANLEQVQMPVLDDVNLPSDGPFVFVSPRPAQDRIATNATAASLAPVQLTPFALERLLFLSITNDVPRGNLYLRLGTAAGLSPVDYDFKVPPRHTWQDPGQFGSTYSGDIFGVWDEVTSPVGRALYVSNRYG